MRDSRNAGPAMLVTFAIVLSTVSGLDAQTYRGTVIEARSGQPIDGAILRGSPGGYVDVTLENGIFEFVVRSVHQPLAVVVSRQGYASETFVFDRPSQELVLELAIAPIELQGISAEITLEQRLEDVEEDLDARYAPHRGIFRSVGRDIIRTFDERHEGDPYAMLSGALDLHFDFNAESDVMRTRQKRKQFEVFIDDVRVPLVAVIRVPNDQICRAEMFHTVPALLDYDPLREPTPQLRTYTCSFMGRVATGHEKIQDRVCWNELVAWRKPTKVPSGCTYRR